MSSTRHRPGGDDASEKPDSAGTPPSALFIGYHTRVFLLLHAQLDREGYSIEEPHPIRRRFWGLVPYRVYDPQEARPLVASYLRAVERELAAVLERHCLAYWLHVYRRLAPGPVGHDKRPITVGIVRATLEAAIQKYARFEACNGVGVTGDIPVEAVLGGVLMDSDFRSEREDLERRPQLVLTSFSTKELREFYDAEKLAYEAWRASSMLRMTAKGAPIVVRDSDDCVSDVRSPELARLVRTYDRRWAQSQDPGASATGVVFDYAAMPVDKPGMEFLPIYNLGGIALDQFAGLFGELSGATVTGPMTPNFIWFPFNLREYRDAHAPFREAFEREHGVDLDVLLMMVIALCQRVWVIWRHGDTPWHRAEALVAYWQRAYDGPHTRESVRDEIDAFLPIGAQRLGQDDREIKRDEVDAAFAFLELDQAKRGRIDLAYPGPHQLFLPYGSEYLFVDYAYVYRRMYDLFLGVQLDDQNFKGDALERVVREGRSVLPQGACTARDGESRQVDASFALDDRLVIVECRAVWRSVGFDRGDPQAIRYRNEMIDRLLADVDAKAHWLAARAVGANYDISHFVDILSVGVTPFAEYIPSPDPRYWLNHDLPRVLTPSELRMALENGTLTGVSMNLVPILRSA